MPVSANLDAVLNKEWEDKSLEAILNGERSVRGLRRDTAALRQAFNVKTVGDLGRNKYFRAAQALALPAESTGKK